MMKYGHCVAYEDIERATGDVLGAKTHALRGKGFRAFKVSGLLLEGFVVQGEIPHFKTYFMY